jgi:hypothetical protein
LVTIQ